MASTDDARRKFRKAKVDRISSLPDEVLSLILSLVPTKCAVGTSILSNRWKYLWTSITSFDLEGPPTDNLSQMVDFTNFVNKVFRSCNSPHIQKFSLHLSQSWDDKDRVTSWIGEAIKRNATEVDVDVKFVKKLPLSIFSGTSLSVLKLSAYDCDGTFNLPCLKVLHIKGGSYRKDLMEKLISSCPVLEDLTLSGSLTNRYFIVSSPALKTLRLHMEPVRIYVEAPNLEYLHLSESFIRCSIEGDFPSLVKAYVNIGDVSRLLRYYKKRRIPLCFRLPKFQNLTCLEVITCDNYFWAALPKLIISSPKLEVLSLYQGNGRLSDDEYTWVGPKSVPKCFGFHLAVIKIKGFKGRKHELQLIKYCLLNAKVLESLSINCRGLTQAEETHFCGQLLKFSRASESCQIQFHGDVISNL